MLSIVQIKSAPEAAGHYYTKELRVEDYYLKGQEPAGVWKNGKALGLEGFVEREQLDRVFAGQHPKTGKQFVGHGGKKGRMPGWDLTFSAPKSVSVLYGAADDEIKEKVRLCHHRAVEAAMAYNLEENFDKASRRTMSISGKKVTIHERATDIPWAEFFHRTSRELDPQLHSHVVVPNIGRRKDRTWGAINIGKSFQEKLVMGALYRAELASQLKTELGLEMETDRVFFRVKDVPIDLEEHLSKRRQQIEAKLIEGGLSGAVASERAARDTRRQKKLVDERVLFSAWQSECKEFGFDLKKAISQNQELHQDQKVGPESNVLIKPTFQDLAKKAISEVSYHQAVFTEQKLKTSFAVLGQTHYSLSELRNGFRETFKSEELIRLKETQKDALLFTTKSMRTHEQEALALSEKMTRNTEFKIRHDRILSGIDIFEREKSKEFGAKVKLSSDQKAAVIHVLSAGQLKEIEGLPGTGKSFAMEAVADILRADGIEVRGLAPSGRAAVNLSDSKIDSQTIDRYFTAAEKGATRRFKTGEYVVIDEAGMIGTQKMKRLLEELDRCGSKGILLGDSGQFQPIEAGGIFKAIGEKIGRVTLTNIVRQREDWQRDAVKLFRAGDPEPALAMYRNAGQLNEFDKASDLRRKLVEDFVQDKISGLKRERPESSVILTKVNAEIDVINDDVRRRLKEEGLISERRTGTFKASRPDLTREIKTELSVGDRVVFLKNDRRLEVQNGLFATVKDLSIGQRGKIKMITFEVSDAAGVKTIEIDPEKYNKIRHAYAVTGYKSQGSTFSRAFVHGTPEQVREEVNVNMSRHKIDVQLYVSRESFGLKPEKNFPNEVAQEERPKTLFEKVSEAFKRSDAKGLSLDYTADENKIYRTERLVKLSREIESVPDARKIEILQEIAVSHSGVKGRYDSPTLNPPWQSLSKEILESNSFDRTKELSSMIGKFPRGREAIETSVEKEYRAKALEDIAPTVQSRLDAAKMQESAMKDIKDLTIKKTGPSLER